MTPGRGQSGVALITILLIVFIAAALGVEMARDQNQAIQKARHYFTRSQAAQYAVGGEELARQILWEDFNSGAVKDHQAELWGASDLQFEFENGVVNIEIEDLSGRLNINNLASPGSSGELARVRFANLLAQLGIDLVYVDRIADWVDADATARQLGAEDYAYLGLERPYRSGNQLMVDASELRLLLDMDTEIFNALAPYVAALPDMESKLNINTASPVVLQALSSELSLDGAERLAQSRVDEDGFDSTTEFLQLPDVAGMGIIEAGLGVQSMFFEVRTIARYEDRFAYLTSVIQRDPVNGEIIVIYRNSSKKILPVIRSDDSDSGNARSG